MYEVPPLPTEAQEELVSYCLKEHKYYGLHAKKAG
jgi:hypothetical protein